jgi:hypothetical protein
VDRCDAEEGSERGVPGAAAVKAEDELVEIGLKMFAAPDLPLSAHRSLSDSDID